MIEMVSNPHAAHFDLVDEHTHPDDLPREHGEGRKDDLGKDRWSLLPIAPLRWVVKVLTFGAKKYAPENWKKVPNPEERYTDALLRHVMAHVEGETLDPETNLPHLAHAVCCALFLMWFEFPRQTK